MGSGRVRNRQTRPAQPAHAGDLLLGVPQYRCIQGLLSLENGVNALRWDDGLVLVMKDERGILSIEDYDIDLVAEGIVTVNDMGPRRAVPLRQVGFEEFHPHSLASVTLRTRVRKRLPSDRE